MARRISFSFDARRFVNASAYIVERCPEVTKMKLSKLLYFADKEHLLAYGKPITGDRYVKMEYGPVPSSGYNLLKRDERASVEDQTLFDRHLSVDGNDLSLKEPYNPRALAETDREIIDSVLSKYGNLSAAQLSKVSHHEPAWSNAEMNADIDYRLFFAGSEADAVRQLIESDQEMRDVLDDIRVEESLGSLRS